MVGHSLSHIPGTDGIPLLGETLQWRLDAAAWARSGVARFGPVFRSHVFFEPSVVFTQADAARHILIDR
ncbi:MAG: hypothetical protein ACO3JL_09040 [Myxococcota bacterium]